MRYFSLRNQEDIIILVVRIFIILLFLISGINKINNITGTISYMANMGLPLPTVTTWVVIALEILGSIALLAGFYTRPVSLLLVIYTIASAFIGHKYWAMTGMEQYINMISFYKNFGIAGGFLLLALCGPGRYSLDRK